MYSNFCIRATGFFGFCIKATWYLSFCIRATEHPDFCIKLTRISGFCIKVTGYLIFSIKATEYPKFCVKVTWYSGFCKVSAMLCSSYSKYSSRKILLARRKKSNTLCATLNVSRLTMVELSLLAELSIYRRYEYSDDSIKRTSPNVNKHNFSIGFSSIFFVS